MVNTKQQDKTNKTTQTMENNDYYNEKQKERNKKGCFDITIAIFAVLVVTIIYAIIHLFT